MVRRYAWVLRLGQVMKDLIGYVVGYEYVRDSRHFFLWVGHSHSYDRASQYWSELVHCNHQRACCDIQYGTILHTHHREWQVFPM